MAKTKQNETKQELLIRIEDLKKLNTKLRQQVAAYKVHNARLIKEDKSRVEQLNKLSEEVKSKFPLLQAGAEFNTRKRLTEEINGIMFELFDKEFVEKFNEKFMKVSFYEL